MSYPPPHGSNPGYYAQNMPNGRNGYNYPPHQQQQIPNQQSHYHPSQYQAAPQVAYSSNGQQWRQNMYSQYSGNGYPNSMVHQHPIAASPQQQVGHNQRQQFAPPVQSQTLQPMSQDTPNLPATQHATPASISPAFINPAMMASVAATLNPEQDPSTLLVALAEEYFTAAHQLAPAVAMSMNETELDEYEELISAGLGCLGAALRKTKLTPRVEARIRLRYAGILFEETNNDMEVETTLSQGITLCERNRYFDLKYAMQFLLAQCMAKKTPKAAVKALDGHAIEAQTYQHFSWVYAFRFLRTAFSLSLGGHVDVHAAIQNLRHIAKLSSEQQDYAIHMTASLWEAMIYMRSTTSDALQNVQAALGKAWSNQLNVGNTTQLLGIAHFVQVACSIRQGIPVDMHQKLKEMQIMMDSALNDGSWSLTHDSIALPINRTPKSSTTVSADTRSILGIGEDGRDNLMLSFMSAKDAYAINYLLCGMVNFQRNCQDSKAVSFFNEGLALLEVESRQATSMPGTIDHVLSQNRWRGQVICYMRGYLAFLMAIVGQWSLVKDHIDNLKSTSKELQFPLEGSLDLLSDYLEGVYCQGTGNFEAALRLYQSKKFDLTNPRPANASPGELMDRDISILAALNRLSILQLEDRCNAALNTNELKLLEPFCASNPSTEIQTAYHLLLATIQTNPESQMFEIKTHLKAALNGAQRTANQQFTCMTLNIMCDKFFRDVVGSQAEKSAKAAAATAHKVGNPLWRSVAEGMVGRCYTVQGKLLEAQENLQLARRLAHQALPTS